jgi:hypothetical protein
MSDVDLESRNAQRVTQHLIQEAFRDAHDDINALGGVGDSEYWRGFDAAISKSLAILEDKMAEVAGS